MKWSLPVSGRHGYKTLSKPELFQASLQPRWLLYLYIIHSLKYNLFHFELTFCHLLRVAVGVHCGMFYCKCTRGNLRHAWFCMCLRGICSASFGLNFFPFQHTGMNIRRLVALLDLLAQLLLLMKIRQVSHAAVSSLSNKTFMRIYTLLFPFQCNLSVHDAQECNYIKNIY